MPRLTAALFAALLSACHGPAVETPKVSVPHIPSASTQSGSARPAIAPSSTSTSTQSGDRDPETGLRFVAESALTAEAQATLRLIRSGGPFPYSQDGVVYNNYNGRLPRHTKGWYHEYTVVTPGERDRGPRRIVAGRDGRKFFTIDHYNSFRRIQEGS